MKEKVKVGNLMCKLVSVETNYGTKVKVADIKKNLIENIIQAASLCNSITEIILFGSAIEERCKLSSDIDMAIISNKSVSALSKMKSFNKFMDAVYKKDMSQEYDRLYFRTRDEIDKLKDGIPICNELVQKGIVVYKKGING